jgi:hypothetical protein
VKADNPLNSTDLIVKTLSPTALKSLKRNRIAYFVIITISFIIGTAHEKAIITTTSTLYIMMVGLFTVNSYLRDHPSVKIISIRDLVLKNPINYLFLILSITNWWNDIFLQQSYPNLILILYGIFLFEMMILSSLLYIQLAKIGGNLRYMQPNKELFVTQKTILLAFVSGLGLGLSQTIYIVIFYTEFPQYLLIAELVAITVVGLVIYILIENKDFLPIVTDGRIKEYIETSSLELNENERRRKKTILLIFVTTLVLLLIISTAYLIQKRYQLAYIYLVITITHFMVTLKQYREYLGLKK